MQLIIEPTDQWHVENGMAFRLWKTIGIEPPITIYVAGCSVPIATLEQPIAGELIEVCTPPGTTASSQPE